MQKVRSMEVNLSVLEEYLKELNQKQDDAIPHINKEISRIASILESGRNDIKDLAEWKENTVCDPTFKHVLFCISQLN